ncbi:MAG: hypothetical protein GY943_28035 [Chloroflexi bacterium]|nr:hypothetical protein [Chloroflexota bacterium]
MSNEATNQKPAKDAQRPIHERIVMCIDDNPTPENEGNLTSVDEFKPNKYYWVRYNCNFLIARTEFDAVGDNHLDLVIRGEGFKHPLTMALKVFAGGIYGPIEQPYDT